MSNIVSLELRDCQYCFALPPLGILPSLKELLIIGLEGVEVIGPEFYGNNSSVAPFESLQKLTFSRMDGWVEWDCQNASGAFPSLEMLSMNECPKLKNQLPKHLPSLLVLYVGECMELVASLPCAPKLHDLYIDDCGNVQWESLPSTLNRLSITGQLSFLEKAMYSISKSCLQSLSVRNCPQVECGEGFLPSTLKTLGISMCPKLIASRMKWDLHTCTSITDLFIEDENVDSFPEQGLLPPTLTFLGFWSCSNLKTLDYKGLCHLTSLKILSIRDCPRLQCLPKEGLPSSLSELQIINCPMLKQRCQKQSGEDWSKISHIPRIDIR